MLPVLPKSKEAHWYAEGLPFKCTGCGACCTGSPGYTWVSQEEIENIAAFLNMTPDNFSKLYLRWVDGRYSLLEDPKNYDCIFLKGNRCSIYPARPIQCKTFPWWPQYLASKEAWKEAIDRCEGISHTDTDGNPIPLVPFETIEQEKMTQEQSWNNGY